MIFEIDKNSKIGEFTYIPYRITRGANIYRYNDDTLGVYLTSAITGHRLLNEYSHLFRVFQHGDHEMSLLFPESRIEEAAVILKAKVQGKNISPRSKRNITKKIRSFERFSGVKIDFMSKVI